jgi:hypothetical protein
MEQYYLVGAADFIQKDTAEQLGYNLNDLPCCSSLVYSKNGELDEGLLFLQTENKFHVILDHFILKLYTINQAKENLPELFL